MEREYQNGDVVQLNEKTGNPMLRYCFMIVTEPKSFGAQGFVQCTGENMQPGGQAYYRAKFEEMDYIGKAVLVPASDAA
jgi:hypothetical protein